MQSGAAGEVLVVKRSVDLVAEEHEQTAATVNEGFEVLHRRSRQGLDIGQHNKGVTREIGTRQVGRVYYIHLDGPAPLRRCGQGGLQEEQLVESRHIRRSAVHRQHLDRVQYVESEVTAIVERKCLVLHLYIARVPAPRGEGVMKARRR